MKSAHILRFLVLTVLVTVLAAAGFAAAPAFAAGAVGSAQLQTTSEPVDEPEIAVTAILPDTGDDTTVVTDGGGSWFSNWILWAVLGLILLVLLVAMLTRPAGTTHHHHD